MELAKKTFLEKCWHIWSPPIFRWWGLGVQRFSFWLLLVSLSYGLWGALYASPPDYQQGEAVRLLYIHVPCAIASLVCYVALASFALLYWVWHLKVADKLAESIAYVGALMTALALITGSLWGRPMWGTFWIWDARLTSEFILLLLYIAYLGLRQSIPHPRTAAQVSSLLAWIGLINVPIVHYSVVWWQTLHQGSSLGRIYDARIDHPMLYPLLAMMVAVFAYCSWVVMMRVLKELATDDI